MRITYVEMTPNPNALKFNLDGKLIASGSRSYGSADEAEGDPLAAELFQTGQVTSVFLMPSFVTVSKAPQADWNELKPVVQKVLLAAEPVAPAEPLPSPRYDGASEAAAPASPEDAERLLKINSVLDAMIRPALAGDGGGIEVLGLDGKELRIRYQGACGSCPSSIAGTLGAIQNMLRVEVDPELYVVPA